MFVMGEKQGSKGGKECRDVCRGINKVIGAIGDITKGYLVKMSVLPDTFLK